MRFFGPLWIAIGNMKNLLIAINYFAMWLEMKPMVFRSSPANGGILKLEVFDLPHYL
ncbi:hypothetical protein HPP92_017766 [Vanilla planifolia]|uniref:Uncharacterized protein n=1 Tax=Vanilla planifolia TaxID=51239 RepID=A0A835Q8N1_VANPL|nr:hypothetical protein HPP92_017766 [Vanilla planifolia]